MAITPNIALTYRTSPASHAPLHVYCDGTGTTSDVANTAFKVFHEIRYHWRVNLPNGVVDEYWATGPLATSKYEAQGPVTGFLLKHPGTYTIELRVWDGTDFGSTVSSNIVVTEQDASYLTTNTICFSNSTDFTGAPPGSTHVTTSDYDAAVSYINANNKRLLFKGGDTFSMSVQPYYGNYSGCTVGSFGTGRAKINCSDLWAFHSLYRALQDNTLVDLEFTSSHASGGVATGGWVGHRGVVYNCITTGTMQSLLVADSPQQATAANEVRKHVGIYECDTSQSVNTSINIFGGMERYTIRGVNFDNRNNDSSTGTQLLRMTYSYKSSVTNNTFHRPGHSGVGRQCIKFHGRGHTYFHGDTTSGSAVLTNVTGIVNWADLFTSDVITGDGIAADSFVVSYNQGAATITMAVNATASAAGVALLCAPKKTIYEDTTLGAYTQYNHIADNLLYPGRYSAGAGDIYISPSSAFKADANNYTWEYVQNNLVERNFIVYDDMAATFEIPIWLNGDNNAARNNVVVLSSNSGHQHKGVLLDHDPASSSVLQITGCEIYNNTIYYSGTDTGFTGVDITAQATNTIVKNNLVYAPSAPSPAIVTDAGVTSTVASNTSDATTDPVFNAALTTLRGFVLDSTSPYKGAGAAVASVMTDGMGNNRGVHSAANDTGAMCSEDKQHRYTPI